MPEAEERDRDRQPDRHDRSEGDQEDDRRGEQADQLGAPASCAFRIGRRRARSADRRRCGLGHLDQARARLGGHVQRGAVELEPGESDRAVARHARRLGGSDAFEPRACSRKRSIARARRVAGAGGRLPDHVDRVTRGAGEALGDQVGRRCGLRPGVANSLELAREAGSDGDDRRRRRQSRPARCGRGGEVRSARRARRPGAVDLRFVLARPR